MSDDKRLDKTEKERMSLQVQKGQVKRVGNEERSKEGVCSQSKLQLEEDGNRRSCFLSMQGRGVLCSLILMAAAICLFI